VQTSALFGGIPPFLGKDCTIKTRDQTQAGRSSLALLRFVVVRDLTDRNPDVREAAARPRRRRKAA
ncbi:MAG: hypothetical protein WDA23_09060, partial [Gemmobacter sp.]